MLFALALFATLISPALNGAGDSTRAVGRSRPGSGSKSADSSGVPTAALGEAVLVEIRIGQLASRSTIAYESPTASRDLLVRVADVLAVIEATYEDAPTSVRATLPADNVRLELDARSGIARRGNARWAPGSRQLVASQAGVVASVPTIARWLDLDVSYDRAGATVDFRDVGRLPVARRLARQASHAAYRARSDRDRTDASGWPKILEGSRIPAVLVDYDAAVSRQTTADATAETPKTNWLRTYTAAVALPMIAGKTEFHVAGDNNGIGIRDLTWSRAWADSRWITQLAAGDFVTRGASTRNLRGLSFTNAAVAERGVVDVVPVEGRLPQGWDIEAATAGQLADVAASVDGRYRLEVPIAAGVNTVDFVASGPNGEERTFQRLLRTAPMFVRPRGFEYSLDAGVCPTDNLIGRSIVGTSTERSCAWGANADARYGVRAGWVLRAGVDATQLIGEAGPTYSPYVGIGGVVAQALSLEATAMPIRSDAGSGLTALTVQYQPSPALTVSTDYEASDLVTLTNLGNSNFGATASVQSNTSVSTYSLIRTTRRTSLVRFAPGSWNDHLALDASESSQWWNGTVHSAVRAGLSLQTMGIQARPYWRSDISHTGTLGTSWDAYGIESLFVPSNWLGPSVGTLWIRSLIEAAPASMSTFDLSVGHVARGWRIEAGMRRIASAPSAVWTISASPSLGKLQLGSYASTTGHGSTTTQVARGSAILDIGQQTLTMSAEPSTGRGGLLGTVYLDRNSNGRRDSGEEGLPNIVVRIGNRTISTDSAGNYMVWGLEALSSQRVGVDSLSLTSPWWTLPGLGVSIDVPSVGWRRVDLAVASAGIVEGAVFVATGSSGSLPTGMRVIAMPIGNGNPIEIPAFSDGTFYRDGLRPGKYALTVASESLAGSGLVAGSATISVNADRQVTNARIPLTSAGEALTKP